MSVHVGCLVLLGKFLPPGVKKAFTLLWVDTKDKQQFSLSFIYFLSFSRSISPPVLLSSLLLLPFSLPPSSSCSSLLLHLLFHDGSLQVTFR